jgi:cytochrome c5
MRLLTLPALMLYVVLCSCSNNTSHPNPDDATAKNLPDANRVELDIKSGRGSEAFIANCQTCHTARYVLMQPKLSRKAWEKTVDKMIHVYGAQIDSLTAIEIVDYLMVIQDK